MFLARSLTVGQFLVIADSPLQTECLADTAPETLPTKWQKSQQQPLIMTRPRRTKNQLFGTHAPLACAQNFMYPNRVTTVSGTEGLTEPGRWSVCRFASATPTTSGRDYARVATCVCAVGTRFLWDVWTPIPVTASTVAMTRSGIAASQI